MVELKDSSRNFRLVGKSTAIISTPLTRSLALEIASHEPIKQVVLSKSNLKRASRSVVRALRKVGITLRTKSSYKLKVMKQISSSKNKRKSLRSAGISKSSFYR